MSESEEESIEITKPKKLFGVRHIQIVLMFLGLILVQCTRTIMSVAIVEMTNSNNENHFDWPLQRQGVILSSFTWGYVIPQVFSGELHRKFGGKSLMIICAGVSTMFSLLMPVAAFYGDWIMVCICRGIQGLMQGAIIPTINYLMSKWVPLSERGRLASFVYSGSYLGIATQFIASGYLADYWGWPVMFYVNGAAGIIWTAVYVFFGSDNPQDSKSISAEERLYIQSSLGQIGGHKKLKTPWKSILTSLPFYATLMGNVGYFWGYWTLLTEIPTYMSKALQVDIKSNGVLSALPYIVMFAMNFPVGFTSDYMIRKNWFSVTACRKIFNSVGFFGAASCLFLVTYIPAGNVKLAVISLCVALGLKSAYYCGFIVVFLDMAHNFTSTLVAVANFTSSVVGLFAPIFAGYVVKDETDPEQWHIVFYVSATAYVVTNVIFVLFATSKEQEWNKGIEISKKPIYV